MRRPLQGPQIYPFLGLSSVPRIFNCALSPSPHIPMDYSRPLMHFFHIPTPLTHSYNFKCNTHRWNKCSWKSRFILRFSSIRFNDNKILGVFKMHPRADKWQSASVLYFHADSIPTTLHWGAGKLRWFRCTFPQHRFAVVTKFIQTHFSAINVLFVRITPGITGPELGENEMLRDGGAREQRLGKRLEKEGWSSPVEKALELSNPRGHFNF